MGAFLIRLGIILISTWVLTLLPTPSESVPLPLKNVLTVAAGIMATGMLLYDTLFHDRYHP